MCALTLKKCRAYTHTADSGGLIALRFFGGLGQGTMYAGLTELLAAWVPLKERTTLASLAYGGSTVNQFIEFNLKLVTYPNHETWTHKRACHLSNAHVNACYSHGVLNTTMAKNLKYFHVRILWIAWVIQAHSHSHTRTLFTHRDYYHYHVSHHHHYHYHYHYHYWHTHEYEHEHNHHLTAHITDMMMIISSSSTTMRYHGFAPYNFMRMLFTIHAYRFLRFYTYITIWNSYEKWSICLSRGKSALKEISLRPIIIIERAKAPMWQIWSRAPGTPIQNI